LGQLSPNEIDATLILFSVKWVLAELLRLGGGITLTDAQDVVERVIERRLSTLWKHEGLTRVLNSSMPAKNQIVILLYDDNGLSEDRLREIIEYKNKTKFRALLRILHRQRLIEFRPDGKCLITPKGVLRAEDLLRELQPANA
jgi:hypothetical protein